MSTEKKPICQIEGEKVKSIDEFFDEVGNKTGLKCEHNINSLDQALGESFSSGVDIVWHNADASQESLGEENFEKIVEVIRNHGPEGKQPLDNVHLHLN